MYLSEAIRDFAEYSRHEVGHTERTHLSYQSRQRHFLRWLEEQGFLDPSIRQVTPELVRRYAYSLSARKLRPRTIRGAMGAIRALFGYLSRMGALPEDPTRRIALPKMDAAVRLLVTDEDLVRLLAATDRQRSDFRCVRDRAILTVLIYAALRRQELLDLKVASLNLEDHSLLVQQGKGQKSRVIPLCEEAVPALRAWLAIRQKLPCKHDYLFATESRRRVGENTLAHMLEEIKAIAGMKGDPRLKPHSIRHAAATRLMRNGADIRSIQAWLGHAELHTTAVYLHTDEHQVRKIAELAGLRPLQDNLSAKEVNGEKRAANERSQCRQCRRRGRAR